MIQKTLVLVLLSCLSLSILTGKQPIKLGTIIILSGTSSAGKSSIVKELQKIYHDEFQVLTIDKFMKTHPDTQLLDTTSDDQEWDEIFEQIIIDFYRHIQQMSKLGHKILVDTTLNEKSEITQCHNILGSKNVIHILDYCSLPAIIVHVKKRNKSGDQSEKRSIRQAVEQFYNVYKVQESPDDQVVDHIHTADMKHILQQVNKERKQFDKQEPESIDKRTQKWQKFSHDFIEQFKLNEMKKITIACKYQYDFIVNTGIDTPEQAARKIADFLQN